MNTQTTLFEKLCDVETLYESWQAIREKKSAGGIDGITISKFEEHIHEQLTSLSSELKKGTWSPQPYLRIEIPKKKTEVRQLGLLSIKDKIVQHAIKTLTKPIFENCFVENSYAYRPNKGHTKAIRRTQEECKRKSNIYAIRLDIDNYFDNINHHLLGARLHTLIHDEEIVRLIMLSMQMGIVNKQLKWSDTTEGLPQGAILSPLLANYYLTPLDKFVLTLSRSYIRYADDLCIMCDSRETAQTIVTKISDYLSTHFSLRLNTPEITEITKGFEFLGITITKSGLTISERKIEELHERIQSIKIVDKKFSPDAIRSWNGIRSYYGKLLPQETLQKLDEQLYNHLNTLIADNHHNISNRAVLKRMLGEIEYLSNDYSLHRKRILQDYIDTYDHHKGTAKELRTKEQNKRIIEKRKAEYHKREAEASELLINTFGTFVGLSGKGITVKQNGKIIAQKTIGSLSHITIAGKGITLSSNLIDHCLANKITIDFFNSAGKHSGSILSTKYMESTLWNKQAMCGEEQRLQLATTIIRAKLKNQYHLVKYFHKYHKHTDDELTNKYNELTEFHKKLKTQHKTPTQTTEELITQLVADESQGAIKYWAYIQELLKDDEVGFYRRERKGATDLVNSMLNYGYAILYTRVWQALLNAKLNPFDSIIHVRQSGKPTFVYDVVEMFRSQVVDRVVISLVQRGKELKIENGLLDKATRQELSRSILERLNRYEKYRGEEITLNEIIRRQAKEIAAMVDSGEKYKPYIAKW